MNPLMETLFDLMNGPHSSEMERRAMKESRETIQAAKERLFRGIRRSLEGDHGH